MKTHTLTIKTHAVNTTPKKVTFRERVEDWLIRKILGKVKD